MNLNKLGMLSHLKCILIKTFHETSNAKENWGKIKAIKKLKVKAKTPPNSLTLNNNLL